MVALSRVVFVGMSLGFCACAVVDTPDADVGSGTGGTYSGTGAAVGTGSAVGTGGYVVATGGTTSTGGVIATGGAVVSTGGAVVSTGGAIVSTGGAVATGGTTSTGGSVGSGSCLTSDGTGTFTRNISDGRLESTGVSGYGFAYVSPTKGGTAIDCGALGATATGICASGTVPAEASYNAVGAIAINVNQAGGTGTTAAVYAKTVTSLTINYQNKTSGTLRVQASTSAGDFCKTLNNAATSVTLTPADFNSACWNGSGSTWNGTGLTAIQLIVPSDAATTTPMNACLNGVTLTP